MASIHHSHRWLGTTHSQIPQQQLCWKKIPIDVNRSNIPSIKNICGTKLVSRSFDTRTITSIWGAWECLSVNNIVPIQCHRHATSHTSRTSRPIQPLTGSNGSGTSLCGYPVPNTKCPWTPGVTKVGRLQQRSLERNHMKRTNPQTTHVDSSNIPFISYLVTLFLPLHIKVSTHTSSCIYIYNIKALIMIANQSHDDKCHFEDLLYLLSFPSVRIYNQGEHSNTRKKKSHTHAHTLNVCFSHPTTSPELSSCHQHLSLRSTEWDLETQQLSC